MGCHHFLVLTLKKRFADSIVDSHYDGEDQDCEVDEQDSSDEVQ